MKHKSIWWKATSFTGLNAWFITLGSLYQVFVYYFWLIQSWPNVTISFPYPLCVKKLDWNANIHEFAHLRFLCKQLRKKYLFHTLLIFACFLCAKKRRKLRELRYKVITSTHIPTTSDEYLTYSKVISRYLQKKFSKLGIKHRLSVTSGTASLSWNSSFFHFIIYIYLQQKIF